MLDYHIAGGMEYMFPLTALLLLNLGVIVFLLWSIISKKEIKNFWLEMIRQIGLFALVWGVLSTIIGLYQAFGYLSQTTENLPLRVIMGGLKVALITAEYGMIVFLVSLAGYLILKYLNRNSIRERHA